MATNKVVGNLNVDEVNRLKQEYQNQINSLATNSVKQGQLAYFVGFDGTLNDKDNLSISGDKQDDNVAQLWSEIKQTNNPFSEARYYAGVGTPSAGGFSGALLPTGQIKSNSELAYQDFVKYAQRWLKDNPDKTVNDIKVFIADASRGFASAVVFSQLLNESPSVTINGSKFTLGKVDVPLILDADGVTTGVQLPLTIPTNVGTVVHFQADNEGRYFFRGPDFTGQSKVIEYHVPGNHGDTIGFYDNGIGGYTLGMMTDMLKKAGVPIANVSASRAVDWSAMVVHDESAYPTNNNFALGQPPSQLPTLAYDPSTTAQLIRQTVDVLKIVDTEVVGDKTFYTYKDYLGNVVKTVQTTDTFGIANYGTSSGQIGMFNLFDMKTGKSLGQASTSTDSVYSKATSLPADSYDSVFDRISSYTNIDRNYFNEVNSIRGLTKVQTTNESWGGNSLKVLSGVSWSGNGQYVPLDATNDFGQDLNGLS